MGPVHCQQEFCPSDGTGISSIFTEQCDGSDEVRHDIVNFALQKLLPVNDRSNPSPNAKLGNAYILPLEVFVPFM